jgi:phosphoglycolate phosphatase-like HAD superfamily hydrolase
LTFIIKYVLIGEDERKPFIFTVHQKEKTLDSSNQGNHEDRKNHVLQILSRNEDEPFTWHPDDWRKNHQFRRDVKDLIRDGFIEVLNPKQYDGIQYFRVTSKGHQRAQELFDEFFATCFPEFVENVKKDQDEQSASDSRE